MALSTFLSKEMLLWIGTDLVAFTTDFDFEVNKETIDVTTLSSAGWKAYLVDLKEWKVSFSGLVTRGTEGATETGWEELLTSLIGSDSTLTISIKTGVGGDQYITGSVFLTSLKMSGSVGDKLTYSGEMQGTGAFTLPTS